MKSHTTIGAQILKGSGSPFLIMAMDIASCHHERWDGKGYPGGLAGEAIPLTARIMNICDQYDALRSRRPYKQPFEHRRAMEIICQGDGRTMPGHFDPEILAVFTKASARFAEIYGSYQDESSADEELSRL